MKRFSPGRRRFCTALAGMGALSMIRRADAVDEAGQPCPHKVGICLGSGALHGYAHVGVINGLEKQGFKPDVICGTSVGAIVGVLWAAGLSAQKIHKLSRDKQLFLLGLPRPSLLGLKKLNELHRFVDLHTGGRNLEELPIPFATVATDLETGEAVTLRTGSAARAVVASATMPLRYEPVSIGGSRLVDGALSAPVPIDAAHALGATFVIGIDVAYRPYEEPVDDTGDVPFQMFHIMVNQLISEQMRRADFAIKLDVHDMMKNSDDMTPLIVAGEQAVEDIWPVLQTQMPHCSQ